MDFERTSSDVSRAQYRLCPTCARAVPVRASELYCINDGSQMLEACPRCAHPITAPDARFCPNCGLEYRAAPPSALSENAP
jgi:predicted amidophosphoribosyltransferase